MGSGGFRGLDTCCKGKDCSLSPKKLSNNADKGGHMILGVEEEIRLRTHIKRILATGSLDRIEMPW